MQLAHTIHMCVPREEKNGQTFTGAISLSGPDGDKNPHHARSRLLHLPQDKYLHKEEAANNPFLKTSKFKVSNKYFHINPHCLFGEKIEAASGGHLNFFKLVSACFAKQAVHEPGLFVHKMAQWS